MSPSALDFESLVVFNLASEKCALPTSVVERVVRAVEITPCPGAPAVVAGLINLQGTVLPVFNLHCRFGLPPHPISLKDHLIIVQTARRRVALLVDDVCEVMEPSDATLVRGEEMPREATLFEGALKLSGEIILIYDLERFLSQEEEQQLAEAMKKL